MVHDSISEDTCESDHPDGFVKERNCKRVLSMAFGWDHYQSQDDDMETFPQYWRHRKSRKRNDMIMKGNCSSKYISKMITVLEVASTTRTEDNMMNALSLGIDEQQSNSNNTTAGKKNADEHCIHFPLSSKVVSIHPLVERIANRLTVN